MRFQAAVNDPSLHPGTSGFKCLKLINCLITINIIVFKKSKRVGSMVGRCDYDKNGPMFKLQTVNVTIIIALTLNKQ